MAGRHINDHQVRLFMTNRRNDPVALAAAKAGFSPATGYRILQDARLPSQRQTRYDRCPTVFFSALALAATVLFWL